jgi:hypothetical protein
MRYDRSSVGTRRKLAKPLVLRALDRGRIVEALRQPRGPADEHKEGPLLGYSVKLRPVILVAPSHTE